MNNPVKKIRVNEKSVKLDFLNSEKFIDGFFTIACTDFFLHIYPVYLQQNTYLIIHTTIF